MLKFLLSLVHVPLNSYNVKFETENINKDNC